MPNDTKENSENEQRRKPLRKQKLLMQNLLSKVKKDIKMIDFEKVERPEIELLPVIEDEVVINVKDKRDSVDKEKVNHEVNEEYKMKDKKKARMGAGRSLKDFGRKSRGSFKYKTGV